MSASHTPNSMKLIVSRFWMQNARLGQRGEVDVDSSGANQELARNRSPISVLSRQERRRLTLVEKVAFADLQASPDRDLIHAVSPCQNPVGRPRAKNPPGITSMSLKYFSTWIMPAPAVTVPVP